MQENSKKRNFGQIDSEILIFIDVGTAKTMKIRRIEFNNLIYLYVMPYNSCI